MICRWFQLHLLRAPRLDLLRGLRPAALGRAARRARGLAAAQRPRSAAAELRMLPGRFSRKTVGKR